MEGLVEISGYLSQQPFAASFGRITLKNFLREYFYVLKYSDLRL